MASERSNPKGHGRPVVVVHDRTTITYTDLESGEPADATVTIASADGSSLVVLAGQVAALIDPAAPVSLAVGDRTFACRVEDAHEHWVRIERPDEVEVRDARRVRRVPTNRIPAQLHLDAHDYHPHVYIEDLSTRGARLLAETDERFSVGQGIGITIDGIDGTAVVRRVVRPEGSNLCQLGLEFDEVSQELIAYLLRTVGAARADARRDGVVF